RGRPGGAGRGPAGARAARRRGAASQGHRPDAHRARHRRRALRRPPQVCAARARQRLRRRHVEPPVPAGARGARARLRRVRVHELLPAGRGGGSVRGHAAADRAPGGGRDPRGVREARPRGARGRRARRGEATDAGAADAVARESRGADVPAGGLPRLRRAVPEPRRGARGGRGADGGRGGRGGGGVLRARAADGGLAGAGGGRMIVGVPKELKTAEHRVGLVPAGAGVGSGFADAAYRAAGAELVPRAADVWARADMIVKVKEPVEAEWPCLRRGQVVFTYFHFAASEALTRAVIAAGIVAIAYETVQLASGELPLLTPMSEVAGRMAVQEGAKYLEKVYGGSGVLLGGVPGVLPAEVLILGGGTVGTNAAKMAAGLGAHVTLLDLSLDRLRYLADVLPPNVDLLYSNRHNLLEQLRRADLVIGAVLLPGAKAPKLVRREDLKLMKPGSVIVDVAVDQGGCIETSRPTTHEAPTYVVDGIIHY